MEAISRKTIFFRPSRKECSMNTPTHNSDIPYLMPILELKKQLPQNLSKIIDYYAVF